MLTKRGTAVAEAKPATGKGSARISFEGMVTLALVSNPLRINIGLSFLLETSLRFPIDFLSLSEITFEWGNSYDDKDWRRLRAILAPGLMACASNNLLDHKSLTLDNQQIDYTEVNGHKWENMPAEDFVGIMSHVGFVGDPLVHTQHHIGASKWQKVSEEEVIGQHQLASSHQRYGTADLKTVENKGHGHAMVTLYYRKIDGEWKLSGLRPTVRWNELEFEKKLGSL